MGHDLAYPRPVWTTEFGWHTASFPAGLFGWFERRWTDEEVLVYLADELQLQKTYGTEVGGGLPMDEWPARTKESTVMA